MSVLLPEPLWGWDTPWPGIPNFVFSSSWLPFPDTLFWPRFPPFFQCCRPEKHLLRLIHKVLYLFCRVFWLWSHLSLQAAATAASQPGPTFHPGSLPPLLSLTTVVCSLSKRPFFYWATPLLKKYLFTFFCLTLQVLPLFFFTLIRVKDKKLIFLWL